MTESIGTARVDLVVDTSSFDAAINSAKRSVSGMSSEAQAEYNKLNAAEKRRIDSLIKQADTLKLTREQQILYNAALKGVPTSIIDELKGKLGGTAGAGQAAAKSLNAYGISAKQTAAALRGVPAQITDIAVALQSGQRPITVLLQQGGQLKDMFGGIVPAARALGGAVLGLINPFTIAAGASLALFLAWKQGESEGVQLRQALALTGNAAGVTADELQAMALSLSDGITTQHKAVEALAEVTKTGKFTAAQIRDVAAAAISMEQATGQAVSKTVEEFAKLKGDPVKAVGELNEQYHFLTVATYEQIKALQAQGREEDAVNLTIRTASQQLKQRAQEVVANAGYMERAWMGLGAVVRQVWDDMLNAGRTSTAITEAQMRIESARSQLLANASLLRNYGKTYTDEQIQSFRNTTQRLKGVIAEANRVISNDPGRQQAEKQSAKDRANALAISLDQEAATYRSGLEKLKDEKIKAQGEVDAAVAAAQRAGDSKALALAQSSGKKLLDAIDKKIADEQKKHKGPKAPDLEPATNKQNLQAFEDELKKEQGLIANQTQLLEANFAARNITAETYYAEQKRLAQENTDVQTKALEGEIAILQSRNVKGKTSIENATALAEKEALLAKVRADGASKLQILNIQEAAQIKQRKAANQAYQDALDQQTEATKAELDSQVLRVSVGDREFEIRSRMIQIYREEAKELLNLARQRDAGDIDPDTYKERADQLQKAVADEVRIVQKGYDDMAVAQKNWKNGALKAFADYNDAANDIAGQTYDIFKSAFSGLEDVAVDFFTKGKADWRGYLDSIAADITRFVVRQQLSKLFKKFVPGGDKEGGNAAALSGAASSLAASAGPLYGAAAALSASAAALAAAGIGSAATNTGSGSSPSGNGGWFSTLLGLFSSSGGGYAKGAAFNGGSVQAFAYGGVVSQPTNFAMSGGRLGLMGEKGPEAIVPLHRGRDGQLGVRMDAANDDRSRPLGPTVVNQTVVVQGRIDSRTPGQFAQATAREQNKWASRNR